MGKISKEKMDDIFHNHHVWFNGKYYLVRQDPDGTVRIPELDVVFKDIDTMMQTLASMGYMYKLSRDSKSAEVEENPGTGLKHSYYDIDVSDIDTIDVDEICYRYGFNFYEGTIFKSLVGIAKARSTGKSRHNGTSAKRDAEKVYHYASKILEKLSTDKEVDNGEN